jgi:membrane protein required for colicin V production
MSTVDIILLILLSFGAYSGYRTGLIIEVIAILALVLAVIGGFKLMHIGMDLLSSLYDGFGNLLPILAFIVIFVLIVVLINVIGKILKKVIDWTPLGAFDNIAGAVVGILKWSFGLSVMIWIINVIHIKIPDPWLKNSSVYPVIEGVAPQVAAWISTIFPSFQDMLEAIQELVKNPRV